MLNLETLMLLTAEHEEDLLAGLDISGTAEELRAFALWIMDALDNGEAMFTVEDSTIVTIKVEDE